MENEGVKGISFNNFRIFKDTCEFDFMPLTILTGANSSGKSTVIKGLKLFRTFEENRNEDWILHFEEGTHQLGDFGVVLNDVSAVKDITIRYTMQTEALHGSLGVWVVEHVFEPDDSNQMKNGRLKQTSIYLEQHPEPVLFYRAEKAASHYRYYLNKEYIRRAILTAGSPLLPSGTDLSGAGDYFSPPEIVKWIARIPLRDYAHFEAHLWELIVENYPEIREKFTFETFLNLFADLDDLLRKEGGRTGGGPASLASIKKIIAESGAADFRSFYDGRVSEVIKETSVYEVAAGRANVWYKPRALHEASFDFFRENSLLDYPQESDLKSLLLYWNYFEYNLFSPFKSECVLKTRETEEGETLRSLIEKTEIYVKELSYGKIQSFYKDIFFIESIRANTQRLYTYFSQGTSFNEFLLKFMRNQYRDNEKRFLSKWIQAFEIGDDIDFQIVRGVGSQIFILRGDKRINVVDLGYGVTQFLPVLLHIIYNCNRHRGGNGITIAVQEPETNLHPKLQSKLADLFIDAHKTFGIRFIIETHSEYLIRKLQYLTAKGILRPEDSLIHYLDHSGPQIRKIRILPDGRLSQAFGKGFFDEADNLALELLPYSLK